MYNFFLYILLCLLEYIHIQYNFVCLFFVDNRVFVHKYILTPLLSEPRPHLYSHPDPLPLWPLSKQNRPPRDDNKHHKTKYNKEKQSLHIKAGKGNPIGGKRFPRTNKRVRDTPISITRSPTKSLS